ncbi:hypothetical protein [Sphingomonas sp.]|uniref:hypothetical protein n=1 Tax=Sphingomonas sp. TaxID=28214 RepID=UPI0031D82CC2
MKSLVDDRLRSKKWRGHVRGYSPFSRYRRRWHPVFGKAAVIRLSAPGEVVQVQASVPADTAQSAVHFGETAGRRYASVLNLHTQRVGRQRRGATQYFRHVAVPGCERLSVRADLYDDHSDNVMTGGVAAVVSVNFPLCLAADVAVGRRLQQLRIVA